MNGCPISTIGDQCTLDFGKKKFNLMVKGKPGASANEAPQEFSILLEFEGTSQVLWDFHRDAKFAWDDPHFSLEWAGDLDQDGKPDLLMTLTEKYSSLPSILFLSSKAAPGELMKRVAEYKVED
jgi:hypothetical protein